MNPKNKLKLLIFLAVDAVLIAICFWEIAKPSIHFGSSWLLNPRGIIAQKERALIVTATLMMLVVALPVYFLIFFFAWKYRADKTGSKYSPDMAGNPLAGAILWAIPITLISLLGVLNWKSTHDLDPYKPIASNVKPITIEVVALEWKFLFIYPEQNIATVNFIEFPENTPISFQLTADAPMSSFWIPQLGSQVYAMPAMSTQLQLMANSIGDFPGKDTEINGAGFSGMKFIAKSRSQADFDAWVKSVQASSSTLSLDAYNQLAEPSENNQTASYSFVEQGLYDQVMMKYMMPQSQMPSMASSSPTTAMPGMDMK